MKVLLVGSGAREHALAWKLTHDDPALELIAAPGNPGIAELAECVPVNATDIGALVALAAERAVDLVVVGPEAPLALGLVDRLRESRIPAFGPTRAAAEIETSKAFAKALMQEAGVPTARAEMHTTVEGARAAVARFGAPVVVKASGLAAGKGVMVCESAAEAHQAIDDMLSGNRFGEAGHEVLVEEFMEGEELSVFAVCDGVRYVILPALQDHKRLLDGDRGPNTGGMGAYVPVGTGADADVAATVFTPTLAALAARGRPFTGLLYAGLMLTGDGPKVVEFNCRFGDPETEALLPVLDVPGGFGALLLAAATGRLDNGLRCTADDACVTVVLAAANYPDTPRTGDVITLPPSEVSGVHVFHAGTARDAQGRLVTAGGRVLAVSAVAPTVALAQHRALQHAARVGFAGKQCRTDIGWREIARRESARPAGARASRD